MLSCGLIKEILKAQDSYIVLNGDEGARSCGGPVNEKEE